MLDQRLISIVVPVYCAEKYLESTLDSILKQTYSHFELLLVDDGSSDGSGGICDRYAAADSRIQVFHNQNAGSSGARNFGVSQARGEYLVFVDSDDLLEPEFLETMLGAFTEPEIDLALCGFERFYHDDLNDTVKYPLGTKECAVLPSNKELCRLFTVPKTSLSGVSVWAKMYKLSMVKEYQVVFPENISYEEDCCFNLQYYRHVRKAVTFRKIMYHYRQQVESLSKTYKPSTYDDLINGYNERVRFANELEMGPDALKKLDAVFLVVIFNTFKKIVKSSLSPKERRKEYGRILDFKETQSVVHSCGLSKYRLTKYLTIASRHRWILAIDLILLEWKRRDER